MLVKRTLEFEYALELFNQYDSLADCFTYYVTLPTLAHFY